MRVLVLSFQDGRDSVVAVGARDDTDEWFLCGHYLVTGRAVQVDTVTSYELQRWVEHATRHVSKVTGEHVVTLETVCDDHPAFVVGTTCCNNTLLTAIGVTPIPFVSAHAAAPSLLPLSPRTTATAPHRHPSGKFTEHDERATLDPAWERHVMLSLGDPGATG